MLMMRLRAWLPLLAAPFMGIVVEADTEAAKLFVGGGLTILSQNELDGAENNGTAAILVHQRSPYIAAVQACKLLGETPWNADKYGFDAQLGPALSYQAFQGLASNDTLYWVAKVDDEDENCRAVDTAGKVYDVYCLSELPTLCSQSAAISTNATSDNSRSWQVVQAVDRTLMTGFRDYHVFKFRGIRYAQKPERFTYSKPHLESDEVMAVNAGADCVQPIGEVKNGSSEDCLFMNIWTPHLPRMAGAEPGELKPVMVYLYGGGFRSGSGRNPNTDGTNLASRGDVVVVSVNYRVGNVGFLAFDDGVHKGNYALSDMVSALEWVKRYIQYFGGDKDKVTLFGESAGAQATHILLGSPKAMGLFHRAIMQSDPQGYPRNGKWSWMKYDTLAEAYNSTTKKVLMETGCLNATDQVACLNEVDGFALINGSTNANGAVVDGTYLMQTQLYVNSTSLASNVSVMTGWNRDEAGVLVDDYPSTSDTFTSYFGKKVAPRYNLDPKQAPYSLLGSFSDPESWTANTTAEGIFNASMRIGTDGEFGCYDMAKAWSGARHRAFSEVYSFVFNRTYQTSGYTRPWCVAPKTAARPRGDPDGEYYKCHAGEQLVVFGNVRRDGLPDRDGLDVPFMQLVVDYWAAFARSGDPNPSSSYLKARRHAATLQQADAAGRWEPVDADRPTLRLLQWNGAQIPFPEKQQCDALGIPLDVLEK